jgi:2-polyprenyl-6-methoxyphenol hydroxylase-like FAD-dependent oxidoreductase
VVLSDRALEFLREDDPDTVGLIAPHMQTWRDITIIHRGDRIAIDGIGFSAIGRLKLLQLLQQRARAAGVELEFNRPIASLDELAPCDLIVAADGVNSLARRILARKLGASVGHLRAKFAWYGTSKPFDTLTQTFVACELGTFNAHHYRYAPGMSTFIVECDARTWQRAGLDRMDDAASRAYCERVFAADLGGHPLVSNKSVWRRFPLLGTDAWWAGNRVLIGDALRSMHFSIGSGTRLAFEDAIALDRAFAEAGEDVPAALAAFERARRPVVEKLLAAAGASSRWYEEFPSRMRRFDALGLAYDYMTRSGRMSPGRLRELAPRFMQQVDVAGLSA